MFKKNYILFIFASYPDVMYFLFLSSRSSGSSGGNRDQFGRDRPNVNGNMNNNFNQGQRQNNFQV